jgi:hypothetical protein
MRMPIRSERDAFRVTIAAAVTIGVALLIGWLITPIVGVALLVLVLILAGIAYLRAANPDRRLPLRQAAAEVHPHGAVPGKRHVLVIANEELSGDELHELILGEDHNDVEIDVLAPVLTSHLHYGVSDIDRELEQARARLERSLAWARAHGIIARGEVGDPNATTAIEDELRDFGADEVIIVTHPRERETWQEHGELQHLRHELKVPLTHISVGDAAAGLDAP